MSRAECSICFHSEAAAINAAVEAGVHQKTIAEQFSVSKFALSRHKKNCLAPAPTGSETTGDQLEKWLRRADDLYLAAGANGDVRSQVSALSAAVRSLQAAQRHESKRQEQSEKQNPSGQMMVDHLDEVVHKYLDSCGDDRCFRCGAPNVGGRYVGTPEPGTFPALVAQSEPMKQNGSFQEKKENDEFRSVD